MEFLTGIIGSVLSGGATGLLGIVINRWFDHKKALNEIEIVKLNHANSLSLAAAESERARLRADADTMIADRQAEAAEFQAAERSLQASYEHDKATYSMTDPKDMHWTARATRLLMALVDFARGMLRPGLTVYLTIITTLMFRETMNLMTQAGVEWDVAEVVEINKQIVMTLLYCFTTCVVWWFGTRPAQSNR